MLPKRVARGEPGVYAEAKAYPKCQAQCESHPHTPCKRYGRHAYGGWLLCRQHMEMLRRARRRP